MLSPSQYETVSCGAPLVADLAAGRVDRGHLRELLWASAVVIDLSEGDVLGASQSGRRSSLRLLHVLRQFVNVQAMLRLVHLPRRRQRPRPTDSGRRLM